MTEEDCDTTLQPFDLGLPGGLLMRFQPIPSGEFWMGSRGFYTDEEPMHRVRLTDPFYLGSTPVTQEQFGIWTGSPEYRQWLEGAKNRKELEDAHKNYFSGADSDRLPAERVTWFEAVGYMEWLNEVAGSKLAMRGLHACLPTEAQWEHACRAGTRSEYWNGDGEAALAEIGWYDGNSRGKSDPVGGKPANEWGLCDMSGNVLEWCRDAWSSTIYRKRSSGATAPVTTEVEGDVANDDARLSLFRKWAASLEAYLVDELGHSPSRDDGLRSFYTQTVNICKLENPGVWGEWEPVLQEVLQSKSYREVNISAVERIVEALRAVIGSTDEEATLRVVRGGSWFGRAVICRSAFRVRYRPGLRGDDLGFRVCLSPGPAPRTDRGEQT